MELNDAGLALNLPEVKDAAAQRHVSDALEFVLGIRKMGSMDQQQAEGLAAKLAHDLINDEYNVDDKVLRGLARSLSLDRQAARTLKSEDWLPHLQVRKLSPAELSKLFESAAKELAADIHKNVYTLLLAQKQP